MAATRMPWKWTIPLRFRPTMRARRAMWGYFLISPWAIGFAVLWIIPIFASLYFGFCDFGGIGAPRWIGLSNYQELFTGDRLFWRSVSNTLYYMVIAVPLNIVVGFTLALLLNSKIPAMTGFRAAYYLPSLMPAVATATVWLVILNPRVGLVNELLRSVGLPAPNWFNSTTWSKPAIILMNLWQVGAGMVVTLAGLQAIPEHLYEAAQIDGANSWQRLTRITIPLMTPTIFYNLVTGFIASSQIFTEAYVTTGGGPLNSTYFYMLKLYEHAFSKLQMGYASAMAWLLMLFVLALTVVTFRSSSSWVFGEGGET
jgi:multiple sugar transport system permease protein